MHASQANVLITIGQLASRVGHWVRGGTHSVPYLIAIIFLLPIPAHATIHYSGEKYAPLPATWAGFLTDHRTLRLVGLPLTPKTPPSLLRQEYQATLERLNSRRNSLTPSELADLGALYLRLGQTDAALDLLRPAARLHPQNFALQANLAAAWQLAGNLPQAAEHQRLAVKLAPAELQPLEQLHLKLITQRERTTAGLDNLFDIHFATAQGHRLGKLPADELKTLPQNAVALCQRLALAFPNDPKLLWQLGELAAMHGDLNTASQLIDLCVGEYALSDPALRQARQAILAALNPKLLPAEQKDLHTSHAGRRLEFRSRRPLIQEPFDVKRLAQVKPGEPSLLAWPVLAETANNPQVFKPTFHPYLQKLEGQPVTLTGFLHPLTDDLDCTSFLLVENPIGCWYCTAPDITGLVFITMKPGTTARFTRDVLTITGTWKLNSTDPEEFLFSMVDAQVIPMK